MDYNQTVAVLREIAPSHLRDIFVAVNLVADELEYAKAATDKQLQSAINQNNYESVHKYIDTSETLHALQVELRNFVET